MCILLFCINVDMIIGLKGNVFGIWIVIVVSFFIGVVLI